MEHNSDRRKIQVTVPPNCQPGDRLDVVIQTHNPSSLEIGSISRKKWEQERSTLRRRFQVIIWIWFVLEISCMIFLTLVIALNKGATLELSEACAATLPATGAQQTTFYMNFFYGFTSNPSYCKNTARDFCVAWSAPNWNLFEDISGSDDSSNYYYVDTAKTMYAAQVLIALALVLVFVATVLHGLVLSKKHQKNDYAFFLGASYLLLIAFALALAAMSNITTSSPFYATNWSQFLRSGATMKDLVEDTPPAALTITPDNLKCRANLTYTGGAFLATAVSVIFVLTIWSLFSGCMSGPLIFEATSHPKSTTSSHGGRRSRSNTGTGPHAPSSAAFPPLSGPVAILGSSESQPQPPSHNSSSLMKEAKDEYYDI